MAHRCPQGHASSEADFCSVCGVALPPSASPPPAPAAPAPAAQGAAGAPAPAGAPLSCPLCGEPGPHGASCPFCCFDFSLPPLPRPSAAAPAAPEANASGPTRLVVRVDASLDTEPDPAAPCPVDQPERDIPLATTPMLIGRHDPQLRQEIPVFDPGASRKHAQIIPEGGALWLVDLGSTNGTQRNGADVPSHTRAPLRPGDEVTLGRWTRIIVR